MRNRSKLKYLMGISQRKDKLLAQLYKAVWICPTSFQFGHTFIHPTTTKNYHLIPSPTRPTTSR